MLVNYGVVYLVVFRNSDSRVEGKETKIYKLAKELFCQVYQKEVGYALASP